MGPDRKQIKRNYEALFSIKQIKRNYEAQFSINSIMKDKIEKKIN
jgi:hypothetical protein